MNLGALIKIFLHIWKKLISAGGSKMQDIRLCIAQIQPYIMLVEEVFLKALSDARLDLRFHYEMGEELIALMVEKDELYADEVEEFFDQYGLFTPKIQIDQIAEQAVTHQELPNTEDGEPGNE